MVRRERTFSTIFSPAISLEDVILSKVDIFLTHLETNQIQFIKSNFEKLGGKVEEGISYQPYTGKFATSLHRINFIMWNQDLEKLSLLVSDAVRRYGVNSVGVYAISYDEITPILIQAPLYEILEKVRWYGSDSIAQNHHTTKNVDSAKFAMKTNFSNPLYSIGNETEQSDALEDELEKNYMK